VVERQRVHSDASEADLAVLAWQRAHLEPIAAEEKFTVIDADTTREAIVSEVHEMLREKSCLGAERWCVQPGRIRDTWTGIFGGRARLPSPHARRQMLVMHVQA
jgi:hypothetical protein